MAPEANTDGNWITPSPRVAAAAMQTATSSPYTGKKTVKSRTGTRTKRNADKYLSGKRPNTHKSLVECSLRSSGLWLRIRPQFFDMAGIAALRRKSFIGLAIFTETQADLCRKISFLDEHHRKEVGHGHYRTRTRPTIASSSGGVRNDPRASGR